MAAYISTYYEKRQMNTWVHLGFSSTYGLIDTKIVFKKKNKTSWADERVEGEGYQMNNEWHTERAGSQFQGVSPAEFVSKYISGLYTAHEMLFCLSETAWH